MSIEVNHSWLWVLGAILGTGMVVCGVYCFKAWRVVHQRDLARANLPKEWFNLYLQCMETESDSVRYALIEHFLRSDYRRPSLTAKGAEIMIGLTRWMPSGRSLQERICSTVELKV